MRADGHRSVRRMPDPGDEAVRLRRQGDSATGPQLGALAGGAQPREEGGYTFTSEPVSVALPSTSLVDVPEAVEITAELAHVTAAPDAPSRAAGAVAGGSADAERAVHDGLRTGRHVPGDRAGVHTDPEGLRNAGHQLAARRHAARVGQPQRSTVQGEVHVHPGPRPRHRREPLADNLHRACRHRTGEAGQVVTDVGNDRCVEGRRRTLDGRPGGAALRMRAEEHPAHGRDAELAGTEAFYARAARYRIASYHNLGRRTHFIVRNSWGQRCGDGGLCGEAYGAVLREGCRAPATTLSSVVVEEVSSRCLSAGSAAWSSS